MRLKRLFQDYPGEGEIAIFAPAKPFDLDRFIVKIERIRDGPAESLPIFEQLAASTHDAAAVTGCIAVARYRDI